MHHDELPLRDSDFAAVRAAVLERIHHRPSRAPRFALAFAAVVMVVVFVAVNRPVTMPLAPPIQRPVAAVRTLPELESGRPARSERASRPVAVAASRRPRRPPTAGETPALRMHIQTADPDIRIIWITQQEGP